MPFTCDATPPFGLMSARLVNKSMGKLTGHISWSARDEEGPPILLVAGLG